MDICGMTFYWMDLKQDGGGGGRDERDLKKKNQQ